VSLLIQVMINNLESDYFLFANEKEIAKDEDLKTAANSMQSLWLVLFAKFDSSSILPNPMTEKKSEKEEEKVPVTGKISAAVSKGKKFLNDGSNYVSSKIFPSKKDAEDDLKKQIDDAKKVQYVSLAFIGETGTGKSTLLRALQDYISQTPFENVRTSDLVNIRGQSQTQASSTFEIKNKKWHVTVIDTPGLNDCKGIKTDKKHGENIVNQLIEVGKFNGLCFLVKGAENRATATQLYVVNALKSHFPRDIFNNIIVIVTRRSDKTISADTKAVLEELKLPTNRFITIDNKCYEANADDGQQEDEEDVKAKKNLYEKGQSRMKSLLEMAYELPLYEGTKIKDVRDKKKRIRK